MSSALPTAVAARLAARSMRLHHWMFHAVRNGWHYFREADQERLRDLGWEPPRPAVHGPNQDANTENNSGEDFLYMHRRMIVDVNRWMTESNAAPLSGWPRIPTPADTEWPVPPAWATGDADLDAHLVDIKSSGAFATFQQWERAFTDPARLRGWTLGQLGSRVEFTIHNAMHMRWCANPGPIRADGALFDTVDPRWDDPAYDWLGDPYASHVNPTFWKLHGWIDDRIGDWQRAHGLTGDVAWVGTWTGPTHTEHDHHDHAHRTVDPSTARSTDRQRQDPTAAAAALEEAQAVIRASGFTPSFWRPVRISM